MVQGWSRVLQIHSWGQVSFEMMLIYDDYLDYDDDDDDYLDYDADDEEDDVDVDDDDDDCASGTRE